MNDELLLSTVFYVITSLQCSPHLSHIFYSREKIKWLPDNKFAFGDANLSTIFLELQRLPQPGKVLESLLSKVLKFVALKIQNKFLDEACSFTRRPLHSVSLKATVFPVFRIKFHCNCWLYKKLLSELFSARLLLVIGRTCSVSEHL